MAEQEPEAEDPQAYYDRVYGKPEGGRLMMGDTVIWENPPELGHFGIGLRKQAYEYWLVKMMDEAPAGETAEQFAERLRLEKERLRAKAHQKNAEITINPPDHQSEQL